MLRFSVSEWVMVVSGGEESHQVHHSSLLHLWVCSLPSTCTLCFEIHVYNLINDKLSSVTFLSIH